MRKSKTLARIRKGDPARVCALGTYSPPYVALAARAGYDCIWLDLEHKAMGNVEVQALLAYARIYDIDVVVRTPTREKVGLYRFLEDGATGLMVPHVSNADEARALVMATKFPPLGDRGLDNAGFDSDFRIDPDNAAYAANANAETFLAIQIETPAAVDNCEEISAVPGVDILFVGPGDLGFRLALEGDPDGARLESAHERVARTAEAHGIAWGCPAGGESIPHRIGQGARFLANTGEFFMWLKGLEAGIGEFNA